MLALQAFHPCLPGDVPGAPVSAGGGRTSVRESLGRRSLAGVHVGTWAISRTHELNILFSDEDAMGNVVVFSSYLPNRNLNVLCYFFTESYNSLMNHFVICNFF